ncbi:MAG TPA: hypothetical protein PKE49_04045 [Leptospiraceae bacterium]|jgi:hypothetical protein|nr:hypothetical protein [Leptospirales bacterium]HMU83589.1 hypothetical protein [Leptospiraceae bacterium]HMX55667.1 hypothetical protein [Leptospiraceae bacterium]HMY47686.1 hypothetical protein [Leptospiraceae bacterium]HNE21649.1 hypothetical protein [Leptospiraceae bacterium]
MLHEYEDMDENYRSANFLGRKSLIATVKSDTLLPENGLRARSLLSEAQFARMEVIRQRTLNKVYARFERD